MSLLRDHGFRVTAAGTGEPAPFARAGIDYRRFNFDRFVSPLADWAAVRSISKILVEVQPDLAQSFDTKPSVFLPLAARSTPGVLIIRTINGRAFLYSSRSPMALTLRPVYRALHKIAARTAAATVRTSHHCSRSRMYSRFRPSIGKVCRGCCSRRHSPVCRS